MKTVQHLDCLGWQRLESVEKLLSHLRGKQQSKCKGTMAAGSHVAQKRWQRGVIALDDAMAAVAQTGDQLKVSFVLNDMDGGGGARGPPFH